MKIEFEGSNEDALAVMEFLLSRYPDADITVTDESEEMGNKK